MKSLFFPLRLVICIHAHAREFKIHSFNPRIVFTFHISKNDF